MNSFSIVAGLVIIIIIGAAIYFFMTNSQGVNPQPVVTNVQGMKTETLQEGSGPQAKAGDKVTVNYVGMLDNGTKFDASADHGKPFQFTLGARQVIEGWELGVAGMKVGEKRKLTIPPELGYGAYGAGEVIPPNATLIFEVELVQID